MSHVTAVVLLVGLPLMGGDDDATEAALLAAVNAYDRAPHLKWVTDHFGGTKHPQALIAGGGCNYLDEDGFVAHLRSVPWADYQVGFAQVAMQGEHNEGFALVEVYRAANAESAGWYS